MPRKIRLIPLQRNILWMLEEAGEEDLATIQVTLKPAEPGALASAIAALVRLRYVRQAERDGITALVLTEAGRQSLTV